MTDVNEVPVELFNRTAIVQRATSTPDGSGGWVRVWVEVGRIPVRCSQPSAAERETAQQSGAVISHHIYAQPGADVARGDRLLVDDLVLDVESVVEPSEPVYLRAACRSVQHEG
ncbi:head-tail adaptor [Saccharopolyspora kobensis]|uniref:Head-tail adaptor n=1 Tax=Saccharopolyspora kobensis TaxID=146035 RepID=A0A1H6E0P7_9PSEU|nr:head-tail adaptor protein [Saccharopolyspora kobensis]SEG90764.1 head-tail adaptor [Saccharopolyspora kobensis]SFD93700.1 head-tail adaptor [Saccharopolyspora kobensis]